MAGKISFPVGVLFSGSGSYAQPARQGFRGAMTAIAHINASRRFPFNLQAHHFDPAGEADRYASLCRQLIRERDVRHVVGCTTSWSRKEAIPVVEKLDALLWYPCVYEGFEVSENLIYVAACANQHLVPLLDYIAPRFGSRAMLVGANYIWGWENNRIARDILHRSGGEVLGERFVSIGDTDIDHLIDEVREKRPDFILNNLIGPSSYAFLRAYQALGEADDRFRPEKCPIISCNLYEGEITGLGHAAAGHFTVSCYFRTLQSPENDSFLKTLAALDPGAIVDAFYAQAFSAVVMIAEAIMRCGSDDADLVRGALRGQSVDTPLGAISVDRWTNHVELPAHIGRARADASFEIVKRSHEAIAPDPFLTSTPLVRPLGRDEVRPELRVVK
ncbi:transporter substrate-binding protein [Sinorhizobium medicae]|nr:transporter substrate-binding protein [Sinorhizobium medicae]